MVKSTAYATEAEGDDQVSTAKQVIEELTKQVEFYFISGIVSSAVGFLLMAAILYLVIKFNAVRRLADTTPLFFQPRQPIYSEKRAMLNNKDKVYKSTTQKTDQ